MAQAAEQGARSESIAHTRLITADSAQPTDLLTAGGYIFACPENLAAMSGIMKDFFDRCYYPVLNRIEGRPYAALICAGSDGENACRQIKRIATGWRLREIAAPLIICTHAQTEAEILAPKIILPADLAKCTEIGTAFAAGLSCGIF